MRPLAWCSQPRSSTALLGGALALGALALGGCGGSETVTETVTRTKTVTRTETAAEGLPAVVEAKRAAILRAADSGDADAVAALASEDFSYTFGGPVPGGPAEYWRELDSRGEEPLAFLARILQMPYTLSRGIYVWPFAYDRARDELTPYEETLLAGLPGEGDGFAGGSYLGWRAGIEPDGDWIFFVSGD